MVIGDLCFSILVCPSVFIAILVSSAKKDIHVGGPGGSGVDLVKDLAPTFRAILGDGFDLIGFDPRGI